MRSISRTLLVSCLVLAAACRGGGDDDGDDTPGPDGNNPNDTTIYDIQNPDMTIAIGADVTVRGVVVTAIDEYAERADGTRVGTIWIQEPAGGEYSGVLVFGAPLSQVAGLNVGDIIDLEGAAKTEFVLRDGGGMPIDTTGRTTTELEPGSAGAITITVVTPGGPAPTPELVDALAIAMMDQAGKDTEWEKWEGVLIEVRSVSQISGVSSISGEANFLRFQVTGGLELDTGLSPFPMNAVRDTCYASIVGIGDYFFNHKILARATADIMGGGTGCPAPEESALCGDGMDNDYDGFADCDDFSCQATDPACVTATTVNDIQMGTVTGTVSLNDVVITGVDDISATSKGVWVADALQAAPYNGLFVFVGAGPIQASWVIGATVDVQGVVDEFDLGSPEVGDKLTEIDARMGSVTFVAAPAGLPVPVTNAPITQLNDIATGEQWEGVLVQLTNLRVSNNNAGQGKIQLTDNAGATILADDESFNYNMPMPPAMDTCYSTFTAISHLQVIDDVRTLVPRSALDMVVGAGCN